jgi:hypothetical protein
VRTFFNGKFDRSGINLVNIGTRVTAALTETGTDTFFLPAMQRRAAIMGLAISVDTVPVNAGTSTIIFYKYDASADAAVALNTASNLETLVTKEGRRVDLLATLTDAQRTLDDGDTIYAVITSSSTYGTQPTNLCLAAELAVLE